MTSATPATEPLPAAEAIRGELVIGAYPFSLAGTTAAHLDYGPELLLRSVRLHPPPPPWPGEQRPAEARRRSVHLGRLLGGWFGPSVAPFVRFYEPPRGEAWFTLAFRMAPWQVQAVGRGDDLLCLLLGHLLEPERAVSAGGHPVPRPLGAVAPVLAAATPRLPPLEDHSADYPTNVFDHVLVGGPVRVRAGVRERLDGDARRVPDAPEWFYGIRIDLARDRSLRLF